MIYWTPGLVGMIQYDVTTKMRGIFQDMSLFHSVYYHIHKIHWTVAIHRLKPSKTIHCNLVDTSSDCGFSATVCLIISV